MRQATAVAAMLMCATSVSAGTLPPWVQAPGGHGPDHYCRAAAAFVASADRHKLVEPGDVPYLRFVHWSGVSDDLLDDFRRVLSWWLNQMSFLPLPGQLRDVPGTQGRLQYLDLRDFGWTPEAWQAVAEREPYTQEPLVDHRTAEFLRLTINARVSKELVARDVYPVVAAVWAPWLFRDSIDLTRSTSYLDLLFASKRFGTAGSGTGGSNWAVDRAETRTEEYEETLEYGYAVDAQGRRVPQGTPGSRWITTRTEKVKKVRQVPVNRAGVRSDFPRNAKEWNDAFGVTEVQSFGKRERVDFAFGSVVEGGRDDPKRGSIVALNNRLHVDQPTGFGSRDMQTFDVFETSGRKDFVEQADKLPNLFYHGGLEFDASERLTYLPNGGQAMMLTNGKGDRANVAAQQAAQNRADPRLNQGVVAPMDCVRCHGPDGGYILPRNLIDEALKTGVDFRFKTREDRNRFLGFFTGWEKRVRASREAYQDLVAETTRLKPPAAGEWELAVGDPAALQALQARAALAGLNRGWDGATLAARYAACIEWIDRPVTAEQGAAELGVPVELAKRAAAIEAVEQRKKGEQSGTRLQLFNRGVAMPRPAWEKDQYRLLMLRLAVQ